MPAGYYGDSTERKVDGETDGLLDESCVTVAVRDTVDRLYHCRQGLQFTKWRICYVRITGKHYDCEAD